MDLKSEDHAKIKIIIMLNASNNETARFPIINVPLRILE